MATLVPAPNASAFWRIWRHIDPPPPPTAVATRLKAVRDAGCGRADAVDVFGENAFMRGEADRKMLTNDASRAIAAAYIAETPEQSRTILAPYLEASDPNISAASRLSMAFVLLRRRGPDGSDLADVSSLISKTMPKPLESDRHYLAGVVALAARDWGRVAREAQAAVDFAPKYYNAHVLLMMAQLQQINQRRDLRASCEDTMKRLEDLLLPLLRLGACPMHVGHIDLAIQRYLGPASTSDQRWLRLVTRAYLAYVSHNDKLGLQIIGDYKASFGVDECLERLEGLDFNR